MVALLIVEERLADLRRAAERQRLATTVPRRRLRTFKGRVGIGLRRLAAALSSSRTRLSVEPSQD